MFTFRQILLILALCNCPLPAHGQDFDLYVDPDSLGFKVKTPHPNVESFKQLLVKKAELHGHMAKRGLAQVKSLELGPCMCGAASHKECLKQSICEPIEEAHRDLLKANVAVSSNQVKNSIDLLSDLANGLDPTKAQARARALEIKVRHASRKEIRNKLQAELGRVEGRAGDQMRFRLTGLESLEVYKACYDIVISGMQPGPQKDLAGDLGNATAASIAAFVTGDQEKIDLAMAQLGKLGHNATSQWLTLPKDVREKHQLANSLNGLAISFVLAYEEWKKEKDPQKMAIRALGIAEELAGLSKNPQINAASWGWSLGYNVGSGLVLAWHAQKAANAIRLNYDLTKKAEVSLQRKIRELDHELFYLDNQMKACEADGR